MERKRRNSSLELLRILCMVFIVAHHYTLHGGFDEFGIENFSINVFLLQAISMFGRVACNIFILITGYFMIKSECKIKKIVLLILEMLFFSIGTIVALSIIGYKTFSLKEIIKNVFPMFYGHWFLVDYIVLYSIAPFLNKALINLDKEDFKKLIIVLLIVLSIIPTFIINSKIEFTDLDIMILMYCIGAYTRLYIDKRKKALYKYIAISSVIILVFSVMLIDGVGLLFEKNALITKATYFSKINSILAIFCSYCLFIYFLNNEFYSFKIDFIAQSVLGIYLFHDNEYLRPIIWRTISPNSYYLESRFLFICCITIDVKQS